MWLRTETHAVPCCVLGWEFVVSQYQLACWHTNRPPLRERELPPSVMFVCCCQVLSPSYRPNVDVVTARTHTAWTHL